MSLYAHDSNAGAQTATEIVAAPGAGKQIMVLGVSASSAVQSQFTIHDEDDVGHLEIQLPTTGLKTHSVGFGGPFIFAVAANKALEFTSTGAGQNAISVAYEIRDA